MYVVRVNEKINFVILKSSISLFFFFFKFTNLISLEKSSGKGIFERVNDILWMESSPSNTHNITTAQELDKNLRFGILSHGIQSDPIYNYGNAASLLLFEQTIENLCQTPSRYSTVRISNSGFNTTYRVLHIYGAIVVSSDSVFFVSYFYNRNSYSFYFYPIYLINPGSRADG